MVTTGSRVFGEVKQAPRTSSEGAVIGAGHQAQ
jgi:hypothetical protein